MKQKKVVILGGGPLQVPAIKELKKIGVYVICVDYDPKAVGFQYADEEKLISTLDVNAICEVVKKEKPDVIMTSTSDAPVRIVSEVSQKMKIPCDLSYEDACAVTIKSVMRERLKQNNVPIPKFVVAENLNEFKQAFNDVFKGRCIIKPADNAGSRGVKLLEGHYEENELEREYIICRGYAKNGDVLLEEIMDGPEVSVESITVNGKTTIITITDKIVSKRPYFVEIGHVEPSRLPENIKEQIKLVTERAIAAMNIKNAPSHTEVIVTQNGPKIVEIAARLGGDYITSHLVPLSTGVNIVRESVKQVICGEVSLDKTKICGAAIQFIGVNEAGIILNIDGVKEAAQMTGVREVKMYAKVGDMVNPLHSSNDRIGHIIACGKDADEAWKNANQAYQKIKLTLEKQK